MGDRDFILGHGQFVKSPGTFMEGMSGLGIPGTGMLAKTCSAS